VRVEVRGRPVGRLLLSVGNTCVLILSNPLLLLLLRSPDVIMLPSLERGDEGGMGSLLLYVSRQQQTAA